MWEAEKGTFAEDLLFTDRGTPAPEKGGALCMKNRRGWAAE